MNIPLINTNDKESINTSLIAIKRATEELNNLIKIADEKMAQLDEKAKKYTDDKINALDVASVGGSGKYISAISETDGKISATVSDITSTVSSGNSQPVTSNAVADIIKNINAEGIISSFYKSTPNYNRYILIKDVTNWYNSTSSSLQQTYSMCGMLLTYRLGGNDRSGCGNIVLSVGYFRNGATLPNSNLMHISYNGDKNITRACLVQYNGRIYLAIKTITDQSRVYAFFGYRSSAPLLTLISNSETVTEIYIE